MIVSNWEDLEKYVKQITNNDNTQRTPLSGATKGEEDVVGQSIICQCKATEDKNFSILQKDILRLYGAADLQDKFPLFFSRNKYCNLLSIPVLDDKHEEMVCMVINYIILRKRIQLLRTTKIEGAKALLSADAEHRKLKRLYTLLSQELANDLDHIEDNLNSKRDNLLMYNLFDGLNNEPKS
jgi:hypothetical protein